MDKIVGAAQNAKAGAVLLTESGEVIYIHELAEWPEDVLGCKVEALGRLEEIKLVPDPLVDEDGAVSAGAEGRQFVLKNTKWRKSL